MKKQGKQNFHLHFRGTFSPFLYHFFIDNTRYNKLDYRNLYSAYPFVLAGFLTDHGMRKASSDGMKMILHNKKWKKIFRDGRAIFPKITSLTKKVPTIDTPEFKNWWKKLLKYDKQLTYTYYFCEGPALVGVEQKSSVGRVRAMLLYIGQYKLQAHKVFSDMVGALDTVLLQISKRIKLSISELECFSPDEIFRLLNGQLSQKEKKRITSRQHGVLEYIARNKWVSVTGSKYILWKKILLPSPRKTSVRGQTAYTMNRKVVGRCKIHLDFTDHRTFKKGDILVTGMTNPQLVPYLKNVSAIITDEGGLMCHAAIIARE
jgi:hypothetical protein